MPALPQILARGPNKKLFLLASYNFTQWQHSLTHLSLTQLTPQGILPLIVPQSKKSQKRDLYIPRLTYLVRRVKIWSYQDS